MDHSGTFIGLDIPAEIAARVALPGGESPEKLHVTLFYKKGMTTDQIQKLYAIFSKMFEGKALRAKIGGIGRFTGSESSGGKDVIYLSVDSADLQEFRDKFVFETAKFGILPDQTHGFTPHLTLAYVDVDVKTPFTRIKEAIEFVITNAKFVPGDPSDAGRAPLKKIDHMDDLKPADFMRLCDLLKRGGLEMSEKLDGSARLEFGVHEGKVWTRSKHGTKKLESAAYPSRPMYAALRSAHMALESKAAAIVESWPKGVGSMFAEVLHTPVPNSIPYGPNALVVHGVNLKGGQAVNNQLAQGLAQPFLKKIGTLGGGDELWNFDYRPTIDQKNIVPDISGDVERLRQVYESKGDIKKIQTEIKEKLVRELRKQKSAYGPEMEGVVISDPESGLTTKLVDKEYFTKLNAFLWQYRERLDKGRKVGDEWKPGAVQGFRNAVADKVMQAPIAKTPGFVSALNKFGSEVQYPPEADTTGKKRDFLLGQWVKKNANPAPDAVDQFEAAIKEASENVYAIRHEWKQSVAGPVPLMAEIAGRKITMHEIVKKRTDEAIENARIEFAQMHETAKKIREMKSPLTRNVAMLKMTLGERLEKIVVKEEVDDAVPATDLIKKFSKQLRKRGIPIKNGASFIASGGNGSAFDLGGGKIFKITKDHDEASSSHMVAGENLKYVAHVFDVFKFPSSEFYGIVIERVATLSPAEENEVDEAILMANMYVSKWWDDMSEQDFDEHIDALFFANDDNADIIAAAEKVQKVFKKIQAFKILDELRKHDVQWHDFSGSNIGKRGGKYVAFDLGVSEHPGPKVPQMKEVVETVIRSLREGKADTVGVTIGRYQPVHKGHTEIIRKLAKQFTKTIVIVAGNKPDQKNPFSLQLRLDMMDASLGDVLNKIEFHRAEYQGKANGFVPGILSDIVGRGGSTIKDGVAINVLVGPDRLEEIKQQFARAVENKERYGLLFDPSLVVVNVLEGVTNDDDADRISGTKVRQALVEGNKELVKQMIDPLLASNGADFDALYERMRQELKQFFPKQIKEGVFGSAASDDIDFALQNIKATSGGSNKFTDSFMQLLKQNEQLLMKRPVPVRAADLKLLGSGQDGSAFDMGGEKVLKLTVDLPEAKAANGLLGKKYKHIATMYDVFKFPQLILGSKAVYGIVEDKLTPLDDAQRYEFHNFALEFLPPKGFDDAKQALKDGEVRAFASFIGDYLKGKVKITSGPSDPDSTAVGNKVKVQASADERSKAALSVEYKRFVALMKKYQMPEIMRDLKAAGIKFIDYHGNNLLKRGNDYVVMDLGRSQSAGAEPPIMEQITRRIMKEIAKKQGSAPSRRKGTGSTNGGKRVR